MSCISDPTFCKDPSRASFFHDELEWPTKSDTLDRPADYSQSYTIPHYQEKPRSGRSFASTSSKHSIDSSVYDLPLIGQTNEMGRPLPLRESAVRRDRWMHETIRSSFRSVSSARRSGTSVHSFSGSISSMDTQDQDWSENAGVLKGSSNAEAWESRNNVALGILKGCVSEGNMCHSTVGSIVFPLMASAEIV